MLTTQARTAGLGSFIGVDFSSLPVFFEAFQVPKYQWRYALELLTELSRIAAKHWNPKDDEK